MNYFNKKQKLIIGIISSILVFAICYYVYAQENQNLINLEQNLEVEENKIENQIGNNQEKTSNQTIIVHVSGAVEKEGIVELAQNSRIADAIEKAGGVKENACMDEINLAYLLEDGMKIYIPTKEEQQVMKQKNNGEEENYITKESGSKVESEIENQTSSGTQKNTTTKININTATQTELETLPGIGPSTASKIINYRKEKGKFKTIEEMKEVSGIGDSKYNQIKNLISV